MTEGSTRRVKFEKKYCPKCYGQFERIDVCPDDGAELRGQDSDPLIGKVFAERYDIQSIIGLGGMSIVYKAQHRLMDRVVAIKMLHSNIKNDHVALERFRMEAQAASSLNHQNIITVYDFGVTDNGDAFFVMDYLDGESLADLLERKGKIPFERVMPLLKQICDGLGAAHKKSIVHRDLKPANVVLLKQDDGTELVKLVDFGIAKLLPGSGKQQQQLTRTGEVFGSPIYMSPEQCQGLALDNRADIYSLGCLMYETMTGEPPLLGKTLLETLNLHVEEMPKPLSEVAPDLAVPPELEAIMFRCMEKNPADRFQNTEEIRDLLSSLSASMKLGTTGGIRAAISGKTSSVPCAEKKDKFRPILMVALAVSLSAIAFGAGFIFFWPGPPDDLGTPATKMFWSMHCSNAAAQIANNKFEDAENSLNQAEAIAGSLGGGGKARLEATLKQKADLYSKWEGHAELLEKTNVEISAVQTGKVLDDLQKQYKSLEQLENCPTDSSVAETNAKLRAEAEVPSIVATAAKLDGRKLYLEEVRFLDKALAVETKLLGQNSPAIARIETAKVDGLLGQRNFPAVRPLLLHICSVREKEVDTKPEEYVRALAKLGQFDLDQNQFNNAEPELNKALTLSEKKKVSKELRVLVMRSWADLLNQTKRQNESQEFMKKASVLEQSASDVPDDIQNKL